VCSLLNKLKKQLLFGMLLQNSIVKYIGFSGGAPALGRRGFDPLGETRTFFETRSVYWDTKSRFFQDFDWTNFRQLFDF
jgi:hypothetical protein